MINNNYKKQVKKIIDEANKKGLIKTYSQFCTSNESAETTLSEDEVLYYTSQDNLNFKKFNIGDIVFVSNYTYKSGNSGRNHIFVIIDNGTAVDIDYFGFLLSSQIDKSTYPYNEILNKNKKNNLYKDSIVKCDDLIKISENEIKFKIGEVSENELNRFIQAYVKYLEEN